jgi:hypothetical protein
MATLPFQEASLFQYAGERQTESSFAAPECPMSHFAWFLSAAVLVTSRIGFVAAEDPGSQIASAGKAKERTQPDLALLPPRPAAAIGGRKFIELLHDVSLEEREAAILREVAAGNFPPFLREFETVSIRGMVKLGGRQRQIHASLEVMPDYLAVGSDDDFVRTPMTPQTAQRIADLFGCLLPTPKIVDAIDGQADVHLAPRPLTHRREAVATFLEHHEIIEEQWAGKPLGLLLTGIKKDIVLSPRIFERPHRLAIYGWRSLNGQPIQPLTIVHSDRYVDYSHGVRLVRNAIRIDDREYEITELLADPDRCTLVSDEGPMNPPRYPSD